MIPTLQVATGTPMAGAFAEDLDWIIDDAQRDTDAIRCALLRRVQDTASRDYRPSAWSLGHTDFQLTRGLLGVSL
jgi:hypothetical protein